MVRSKSCLVFFLGLLALFSAGVSAAPKPSTKAAPPARTKALPVVRTKASPARSLVGTGGTTPKAAEVVALDQGQNWVLVTVPGSGITPDNGDEVPSEVTPPGGGSQPPVVGNITPSIVPPPDPGGQPGTGDLNVYILHGDAGVNESTLPATIKDDLVGISTMEGVMTVDDGGDSVYIVRQDIAEGIAASEAAGELTPEIAAIAEPLDDDGLVSLSPIPVANGSGCATGSKTYNKVVDLSGHNYNKDFTLRGGFSGSFSASGDLTGNVTAQLNLDVKRKKVLFWCVPYGAKFRNVHLVGNATTNSTVTVNGTINYQNSFGPAEIMKPELFSIIFWAGPVPVYIGFNLPVSAGLNLSGTTTGTIVYNGGRNYTGNFDWTCTLDDCSGSGNFTGTPTNTSQPFTAGVSGHLKPEPYAKVGLRAYLYSESILYLQAAVEPHLLGDFWGYTGNTCGDADGDGFNESVHALTFDLDDRIDFNGEASVLSLSPWKRTFSTG